MLSVFDGPSYVFLSFFCYISEAHVTCCLCLTDHRMSFFHFSVILSILVFTASDSLFGIFNLFLILIFNSDSIQFQISFANNSYNDWHR